MPNPRVPLEKNTEGLVQQGALSRRGVSTRAETSPWLWSEGVPFRGSRRGPPSCPTLLSPALSRCVQQTLSLPSPEPPKLLPASASGNLAWELPCVAEFIGVTHTWSHTAVRL